MGLPLAKCGTVWPLKNNGGLPQWLSSKESTYSAGVIGSMGLIPGLGRSPSGGHGNPLQYSCLENPMDREAWWATVHGVPKSQIWLKWLGTSWHDIDNGSMEYNTANTKTWESTLILIFKVGGGGQGLHRRLLLLLLLLLLSRFSRVWLCATP